MKLQRQVVGLAGWVLTTLAAGVVGALGSAEARPFYQSLSRPEWAPPGWVFGPVWTGLYLMMAFAAWAVWSRRGFAGARAALGFFLTQLAANALWSWLFFAWREGAWAFAEVVVLWCLIVVTTVLFGRVRRISALLMLPYLAWVTYAAFLCYATWRMNPGAL